MREALAMNLSCSHLSSKILFHFHCPEYFSGEIEANEEELIINPINNLNSKLG